MEPNQTKSKTPVEPPKEATNGPLKSGNPNHSHNVKKESLGPNTRR